MAKKRAPRILFFTQDAMPTEQEQALADDLGANVGFRHGRIAQSATKPEPCDGVAALKGSLIPQAYARAEVPRVKSITDVNRLKPNFAREVGYSDDDDDDSYPVQVPGNPDNEPNPNGTNAGGEGENGTGENGQPTPPDTEDDNQQDKPRSRRGKAAASAPAGSGILSSAPPVPPPAEPAGTEPATPPATPPAPDGGEPQPPAWGGTPPANPGT